MINLVKKYLDINRFATYKVDFEDLFLSHPNYPSVYAITDSLDAMSIENLAVKVPKEQWQELPESFLAIYEGMMVLVSKIDSLICIETDKGKKKNITANQFLADWNGVIIVIEPNVNIKDQNVKTNKRWFSYSLPFIALIILSVTFNSYSLNNILLLAASLFGFIISVFIVQEKFGIKNELFSKICNINPGASCDSVIKSDLASKWKWGDFSDLPLLFFGVNFLSIAIQPNHSGLIVGFLSLLSIPLIAYSIWLQKVQIKKWCILCLAVSFLMIIQALLFVFNNRPFPNISSINFFGFLFFSVLFSWTWFFIKPILSKEIKNVQEINEFKKFKRNFRLFNFLTNEIPDLDGFDQLEGLRVGAKETDVQLTIIISPSCGFCHKAFQEAFELVSKFPERISLNILFNINPENEDNPYKAVVENLLGINYITPEKSIQAISDWHLKKMKLEEWKEKWTINNMDMKVSHQIHKQYNWCLKNGFNYTPVKIVNGKLFPNEYEISELRYFLNDISEVQKTIKNDLVEA